MEGLLTTVGLGLGALLGVAMLVAVWEQWRGANKRPPAPEPAPAPRKIGVDLDLDALPEPPPRTDQRERQETLDAAFGSMVHGPADPVSASAGSWHETRPMVATTQTTEPITRP